MRQFFDHATRNVLIAGVSLLIAGCGREPADETVNQADANLMFEDVANDQSALESAANATDVEPLSNEADNGAEADDTGETEDEGTVESNVSGM